MGIRLNKVLAELNIGLTAAVEFLKSHSELGEIRDDATPNTKIPKIRRYFFECLI